MALSEKNKQALLVGGILGGAVLIIIVYIGWMFVRPQIANFQEKADGFQASIDQDTRKINQLKANLENLEAKQDIEEEFRRIEQRLPSQQDPIEIFDLLRGYFEGSDVGFNYLEPGNAQNRGRFTEFPFTIRGTARYHEFGQLVNLVECNPDRLMRVTSFKLTNSPSRPSIHPMEIGISTFTFNEKD